MEWINKGINYPDSYVVWPPLFKEESSTNGLSMENIIYILMDCFMMSAVNWYIV